MARHDSNPAPPFLTPDHLSLAASTGELEIVRAIIEMGGDLSRPDTLGDTPLHHVARLGHAHMVEWLLAHGAPINTRNSDGVTPLEHAEEYGQIEIVQRLQSEGATVPLSWKQPKLTDTIRFLHFDIAGEDLRSHLLGHFTDLDDLYVPLDRAVLRIATLPFYQHTILVAVEATQRRGLRERFVLVHDHDGQVFCRVHDWGNEAIYSWNDRFGIMIPTEHLAIAYMRFFFLFVRGNLGRFLLIDSTDDIAWTESATKSDRDRVAKHLIPIQVLDRTTDFIRLRGPCLFKNALFHTDALFALHDCEIEPPVESDEFEPGTIKLSCGQYILLNENLLEEDLPVNIPSPPGLFG